MDRLAAAAWRAQAPPFDGMTLCTPTLATESLVACARCAVELLGDQFAAVALHTAEDWFEHDGFVNEPQPASWRDLRAAVATAARFVDASPWDTYVRRAWMGDGAFYFRWHYYDEGDSPFAAEPPAGGDLDLTADATFVASVVRELAALGVEASTEAATTFFKQR